VVRRRVGDGGGGVAVLAAVVGQKRHGEGREMEERREGHDKIVFVCGAGMSHSFRHMAVCDWGCRSGMPPMVVCVSALILKILWSLAWSVLYFGVRTLLILYIVVTD
jgi:hypothetical protein